MTEPALAPDELKFLRARAHALRPVVTLGQRGLTDAVAAELDAALERHELVKVRLAAEDAPARAAQLEALAGGAGAAVVQRIGHTATLWRPNRRRPVIALPNRRGPSARRERPSDPGPPSRRRPPRR